MRGKGCSNGIEAWTTIRHTHSPPTPAATRTDLMRARSLGRLNSHQDVIPKSEGWEVCVGALSRDHGEEPSDTKRVCASPTRLASEMLFARAFDILWADLEKYGFAAGCLGCRAWLVGRSRQGRSEECRRRLENRS